MAPSQVCRALDLHKDTKQKPTAPRNLEQWDRFASSASVWCELLQRADGIAGGNVHLAMPEAAMPSPTGMKMASNCSPLVMFPFLIFDATAQYPARIMNLAIMHHIARAPQDSTS